jgi:RHS repeat-associated protein
VNDSEVIKVEYEYNDNGIRVAKTVNENKTKYLIDENQPYAQVLEEYTSEGNLLTSYVYGNDLISQVQEQKSLYLLNDGLGSTRLIVDQDGNVTDSYQYDVYGNLIQQTGDTNNNYLYTGEQRDIDQNLDYLRSRYYDPEIGRFISMDSFEGFLRDPMSLHKYQYAHANPANFIDPSGNFTEQIWIGNLVHNSLGIFFLAQGGDHDADFIPEPKYTMKQLTERYGFYIKGAPYNQMRPDLVDHDKKEIFEIKPVWRKELGKLELKLYLSIMNAPTIFQGKNQGNWKWTPGTGYPASGGTITIPNYRITIYPPNQGVITYDYVKFGGSNNKFSYVPRPKFIKYPEPGKESIPSYAPINLILGGLEYVGIVSVSAVVAYGVFTGLKGVKAPAAAPVPI